MEAEKLKEILKKEYGINDEKEFDAAVKNSQGINIGLFTVSFGERRENCETTPKISA